MGEGGNRVPGSKPPASRTLHARLTSLFSWISLYVARLFKNEILSNVASFPPTSPASHPF